MFNLADILAIEHHKPSPKPKKQERKLGDWYYHDETPVKRKGLLVFCPSMKTVHTQGYFWYKIKFSALKPSKKDMKNYST